MRIAIVASRFNQVVTDQLVAGARSALTSHGIEDSSIVSASVPGAFELPLVAQRLAASGEVDAVVCLGAVIRGATDHNIHIATQCAAGLQRVQLDTGVPVVFGVLTTDTLEQALERAGGKAGSDASENKGFEAAETAVEMVGLLRRLPKEVG
ncbi:MAG: 6,7-dimethyl-8-ribityllumazine synthase [Acidimicrobiales bacterium]